MRVAAIDIGSNTVRLLVAEVEDGRIEDVYRGLEIVGLGRGVDESGTMAADSIGDALEALVDYGDRIRQLKPSRIRVVATSASRDASNAGELLDGIEAAVGVVPEVITGEQEAALAFAGAVWGAGSGGRHLVIDPGGGSTEFVTGRDVPESAVSVDIGSVRLTDRMLAERPPTPDQLERGRLHVREMFAAVPSSDPSTCVIGVAGTFTSLAAMHLGLAEYDPARVHQAVLTLEDLDRLVLMLAGMTVGETAAIPSLEPKRAPVILAGAVVAAEAVRRSGSESVTVSESDMLEGVVLGLSAG